MRYSFPMVKWEGCFQSYDDLLKDIDMAIRMVETSRMKKGHRNEIAAILKAARDEIGHLRWELKERQE